MSLEAATLLTHALLAAAMAQQSLEQMAVDRADRPWHLLALALCAPMALGMGWAVWAQMALGLRWLRRYDGPFNGGADKMTLLILACLSALHLAPSRFWQEMALAYLGLQLVLSYFISGQVKLMNPDWRGGAALRDVFLFSAYPASEDLRRLSAARGFCLWGGRAVVGFELAFPLALLHPAALAAALSLAALFHLANALLFGLNRFFWIWLCAYPALIWLQARLSAA